MRLTVSCQELCLGNAVPDPRGGIFSIDSLLPLWQYTVMAQNKATLREKQAMATRGHILGAAFELLVEHPDRPFSHEAVAKAAGVGARTLYRYFPAQADLFEALWVQVRKQSGTVFPTAEAEIVPQITSCRAASALRSLSMGSVDGSSANSCSGVGATLSSDASTSSAFSLEKYR